MQIAESVTTMGQVDFLRVKTIAQETYPNCLVVYGDTNSVFVRFHVDQAAKRGYHTPAITLFLAQMGYCDVAWSRVAGGFAGALLALLYYYAIYV